MGNGSPRALTHSQAKLYSYSKENLGLVNEVVCILDLGQLVIFILYLNIYYILYI